MTARPQLFTRNLSGLSQNPETNSPAEQRDDAKRNFLKTMRPLPTQHYWNVYFDRHVLFPISYIQSKDHNPADGEYKVQLEQLGSQIESVQDFWRYNNNTPLCGVGLSVRFKFHLITVWNRDASKQKSIDALFECILRELPAELQTRSENYFYKKHADHEGFKVPPELKSLAGAQKTGSPEDSPVRGDAPKVSIQSPQ
ncbi:hypothetical protein LLEC1_03264 [Akanthomyces lecanii]|uniref:Uncharacterized protein n=1 Tax=Cordyceps confragosa TaxID=2714763 RepID=A0A179I3T7_CORDF|nr:hypothetical protein LLEC1_03264 [Akanthomyces lecanii]